MTQIEVTTAQVQTVLDKVLTEIEPLLYTKEDDITKFTTGNCINEIARSISYWVGQKQSLINQKKAENGNQTNS